MTHHKTPANSIDTQLTHVDVVILNHDDLQEFITAVNNSTRDVESLTIFTDDDVTRGSTEFNLISTHDTEHQICTQLHHPFSSDDTILDLRHNTSSFTDYLLGLTPHNTTSENNKDNA